MPPGLRNAESPAARLEDVALLAGVSPITVSRALRTPECVAPETRVRIENAVRQLGYVPNLLAGALASASTRTVGLLLPTVVSSIFASTINGLTASLEEADHVLLMAQSGYEPARERRVLAALLGYRPTAVVSIGAPTHPESVALLEAAARAGTMVVETWELPQVPIGAVIGFDNAAVGHAVAQRLLAAGRRRLFFVGGTDRRAAARFAGFAQAARHAGLPQPGRLCLNVPGTMNEAAQACVAAKENTGLMAADAVFASTDVYAVGLLSGFRQRGRDIPGDVALIGLGDLEIARFSVPPLTSVRIDGLAIGRHAAELILTARKPGKSAHIDVGFSLVERGSS